MTEFTDNKGKINCHGLTELKRPTAEKYVCQNPIWMDGWMKYIEMWRSGSRKQNSLPLYKGGQGKVSQVRLP